MTKVKIKKIINILLSILMYLFLALSIFALLLTISARRAADGTAQFFGYQMRLVVSDSMAECEYTDVSEYEIKSIPVKSVVFIKAMPKDSEAADEWYRSLKKGDVLTFRYVYANQITITHRISEDVIEKEDGGFIIELAGDNTSSDSSQLHQTIDTSVPNNPNYVIGKVVGQSLALGWLLSLFMSPIGLILIIIVPCLVIMTLEIIKVVGLLNADKKKLEKEAREKTEKELAELKRKLAELEAQKTEKEEESK